MDDIREELLRFRVAVVQPEDHPAGLGDFLQDIAEYAGLVDFLKMLSFPT
jgi:hypothetical protein